MNSQSRFLWYEFGLAWVTAVCVCFLLKHAGGLLIGMLAGLWLSLLGMPHPRSYVACLFRFLDRRMKQYVLITRDDLIRCAAGSGVIIGYFLYMMYVYHYRVIYPGLWPFFFICVYQLIAVAFIEELFFRGYLFDIAQTLFPSSLLYPIVLTAFLFAVTHCLCLWQWSVWITFFPGILFGLTRSRHGGLCAPLIVHALSNVGYLLMQR